jgi:pyrroloquinoline quinone biosynthesis protein E
VKYVPLALVAELTYRCPLKCVYCSNPLEMAERSREITIEEWKRVLTEARALGALQAHFTGGEPTAKKELVELVRHARSIDLYTNLITSGMGVTEKALDELIAAGLDHVQLSFQDVVEKDANLISGVRSHAAKLVFADLVRAKNVVFTVNLVVHRHNLERLPEMVALAENLGAQKLEIAHVQYNGWAFANREFLLPSKEQVQRSMATIEKERKRLGDQGHKMRIDFVTPDYHGKYPKACMGGWGQKMMLVNPYGQAMPCHSAAIIPGLDLPSVREHALDWIWNESLAFNRFRGEEWMKEPCRSCDRRDKDFGGCHCQAQLIASDADMADPVCSLSPDRPKVDEFIRANDGLGAAAGLRYRKSP